MQPRWAAFLARPRLYACIQHTGLLITTNLSLFWFSFRLYIGTFSFDISILYGKINVVEYIMAFRFCVSTLWIFKFLYLNLDINYFFIMSCFVFSCVYWWWWWWWSCDEKVFTRCVYTCVRVKWSHKVTSICLLICDVNNRKTSPEVRHSFYQTRNTRPFCSWSRERRCCIYRHV